MAILRRLIVFEESIYLGGDIRQDDFYIADIGNNLENKIDLKIQAIEVDEF